MAGNAWNFLADLWEATFIGSAELLSCISLLWIFERVHEKMASSQTLGTYMAGLEI